MPFACAYPKKRWHHVLAPLTPNGEGGSKFGILKWSCVENDHQYSPGDSMWGENEPTYRVRVMASQYTGGAEMVVSQCAIGAAGQA